MAIFTSEQHQYLLSLARTAISAALDGKALLLPRGVEAIYMQSLGAFVTLTRDGALRGCIGYPEPVYPLYEAIMRGAVAAALEDPRFPPVRAVEFTSLRVEISVLSPLTPIAPDAVVVGTHGLVIEKGGRRGLLLPQVPLEYGWSREEFLAYTCRKAGLSSDAWHTPEAHLFGFTAEVFHEA